MIWIAVGIGALLVLIGCPMLMNTWFRRKNWFPVDATCTECPQACGKTQKKYRPVFEYTYAGKAYTEESETLTKELNEGEMYKCYCNPERPESIIIAYAKYEPLLMAIGCVIAFAASIFVVLLLEGIIKL